MQKVILHTLAKSLETRRVLGKDACTYDSSIFNLIGIKPAFHRHYLITVS